jgi:cell division protein FtsA
MGRSENLVVGLDIGTSKIAAIAAEINGDDLNIIGIGSHPSHGLRKGVVVNIENTVSAIRKAVEEAELMGGCNITSVYTGISNAYIRGLNSHGIIAVNDREVKEVDVQRVIDAARKVKIPVDREILHVIPQEYIVDQQDGVKDPIGMSTVRLEVKVHMITAPTTATQNIVKCCNRAGLNVENIIFEPLAAAEAVLGPDEKELGVALVDIGGGTTDICIFSGSSLVYSAVLPLGGNHLTNDIAVGLRTPAYEAEKLKQRYGCVLTSLVEREETIEVPSVGGRNPKVQPRQMLSEILEPRVEEIFKLVKDEIEKSGYENRLAAGIVLTGGCSVLEGMPELAEQVFNLPVRRGSPKEIGGLIDVVRSPIFATSVGLALLGSRDRQRQIYKVDEKTGYTRIKAKIKELFDTLF